MTGSPLTVGVLVLDDAAELEVVGPVAVLRRWAVRSSLHPEVVTASPDGSGVRLEDGVRVLPDLSVDDVGTLHVLLVPGGPGARRSAADADHLTWLRTRRRTTPLLAAIGDGSVALAAAGLLAGRPVAAQGEVADAVTEADPSVLVDTEARLVDDGDVVTSVGGTGALDLALHLVERLEDAALADRLARELGHGRTTPGVAGPGA